MSTIKQIGRFLPTPPPSDIPVDAQSWLREEFDRLSLTLNGSLDFIDALKATPRMFLGGDAGDFLLDETPKQLINYTLSGAWGIVPIEPDPIAGTITLPVAGVYRLTVYITGDQGNNQNNDSMFLDLGVNGILSTVVTEDVSPKTDSRSFSATFTRSFEKDEVITMWMHATDDMGIFSMENTALEMVLINLPPELENSDINVLPWFP